MSADELNLAGARDGSGGITDAGFEPRIFSLQKLVEVIDSNITLGTIRGRGLWSRLWRVAGAHFVEVITATTTPSSGASV